MRVGIFVARLANAGEHRRHRVVGRGESRQTTVRPVRSFRVPAVTSPVTRRTRPVPPPRSRTRRALRSTKHRLPCRPVREPMLSWGTRRDARLVSSGTREAPSPCVQFRHRDVKPGGDEDKSSCRAQRSRLAPPPSPRCAWRCGGTDATNCRDRMQVCIASDVNRMRSRPSCARAAGRCSCER
jgi:hypothetical protein